MITGAFWIFEKHAWGRNIKEQSVLHPYQVSSRQFCHCFQVTKSVEN